MCQLDEYCEQLSDIKREISAVGDKLLALTPEEAEALPSKVKGLEKLLFNSSIRHKELSRSRPTPAVPAHSDSKGVKLPKLDVPIFTGNIIDWAQFWEQYCIAVHDRSTLSDAEKFHKLCVSPTSRERRSCEEFDRWTSTIRRQL